MYYISLGLPVIYVVIYVLKSFLSLCVEFLLAVIQWFFL